MAVKKAERLIVGQGEMSLQQREVTGFEELLAMEEKLIGGGFGDTTKCCATGTCG